MSGPGVNTGLDHPSLAPLPGSCRPHREGGLQAMWVSCGTLGTTPAPPPQAAVVDPQTARRSEAPTHPQRSQKPAYSFDSPKT